MRWTEGESAAVRQFVGSDRALTIFLNQTFSTNRSLTNVRKHRQRLKVSRSGYLPWAEPKAPGVYRVLKEDPEIVKLTFDGAYKAHTFAGEVYEPEEFLWGEKLL